MSSCYPPIESLGCWLAWVIVIGLQLFTEGWWLIPVAWAMYRWMGAIRATIYIAWVTIWFIHYSNS